MDVEELERVQRWVIKNDQGLGRQPCKERPKEAGTCSLPGDISLQIPDELP